MKARKLGIWITAILVAGVVPYCGDAITANYGIGLIL
jgi:hypothetical protein